MTPTASLVIGGDSLCGRAIAAALRRHGRVVVETSQRARAGAVPFDLRAPNFAPLAGRPYAAAYLCAAITNMKSCEDDPEGAEAVNVIGTLATLRWLSERRVPTVFLSSSQVFDGETPAPGEDAPTNPRNIYGRQKRAVEVAIRDEGLTCAVLRVTKVLAPEPVGVFKGWYEALRRGEPITAATNLTLAPVAANDVAQAALLVGGSPGIWHLSSKDEILYSDAARLMADIHGFPAHLVRPEALREEQVPSIFRHRHTVIGMGRIEQAFGVQPPKAPPLLSALFRAFGQP